MKLLKEWMSGVKNQQTVSVATIAEGNYDLRIKNEKDKVVVPQVFVKMREGGL